MTNLSPVAGVNSRALKIEKSETPPFPVGGGAVVTNGCCISMNKTVKD